MRVGRKTTSVTNSSTVNARAAMNYAKKVERDEQRARKIAFDALMYLNPDQNPSRLGMQLGFDEPMSARANVESAKRCKWWDESLVDHVIGCFVTSTRDGVESFSDREAA